MSTKIYSKLHGLARMIALVAILCLPFLSVSVEAQCAAPTGIRVATSAPEAVTLQWTVAAADEHHYDIRVATRQLTSAELGAGAAGTVTAATEGVVFFKNDTVLATSVFQVTGLTAGSQYYLHLRKNCAWDDAGYSSWVTYAFNTPCQATAALPIAEGFNADALPSCWSLGGNAPTVYSSTKHGSEGKSIKLTATASEGSFLYSPVLATSANAYYLTGFAYGAKDATLKLGFALTEDLQTVVEIGEVKIASGYTWQAFDAVIPAMYQAACASAEYVWVIYTAAGNTTTVYVDDVTLTTVPPCVAPVALEVNNITETTAALSWTERGTATAWNVQLVQGTDTTIVPATANPFTLSNLSANTSYKVRVQAACGSEDSDWTAWVSFKTLCGVLNLPFVEDFTGLTAGVPDCWDNSEYTCSSSYTWKYYSTGYAGPCLRFDACYASSGSTGTLYTPVLNNGSATALYLSYYMKNGGNATLDVYVSTDGGQTYPTHLVTADKGTSSWAEYEFDFTAPANSSIVLKFLATSDYGSYRMDVDNIEVKAVPTCIKPKDLELAGVTAESAKLTWTAGASETSWVLKYKLGTDDVQTVVVNGTPEYTITGLDANTSYTLSQLSLQSVCSMTDSSYVYAPANITFRTACGAVELPIVENVTASTFPSCWIAGGWTIYTSASSYTHTGSNAFRCYYSTTDNDVPMQSPSFEVEAGKSYYVQFYMYHGSSDTYNRHLLVSVAGAEQLQLDTVFYKAASAGVAKHVLTWTATTSGVCNIQFKGNVPYTSSGSLYLDDIEIDAVPSCSRPEALEAAGVNPTTLEVNITDPAAAHTAWEIAFGPKGCNPDSVEAIAVSAKKARITVPAMTAGAQYDVYVRAVCGANDKSRWTLPFTFKFIDWSALSPDFVFVNSATYPWTLAQNVGTWTATSGNKNVDSSESDLKGVITVEPNTKVIVSFDYFVESESPTYVYDYLCIFVDGATTNLADFGKLGGSATQGTYTLTFNTPGEHSITWRYRKDSSGNYGIDAARISNITVRVISCVEPTTFNLASVTGTDATVNWNATSADQYEVRLYNALQATLRSDSTLLSVDTINATSKNFAGLRPNTQYYVYVRSLCGGSPSDWSSVFSFRTECAPYQLPFAENFEAAGSELCWKVIGNAVTMNATSAAPFEGAKSLSVYNDSVVGMLVSPRLDAASLAAYEVTLAVKLSDVRYHAAALKPLTIGVMTDPSNAGTYVDLGDIVIPSANSWKEYSFSLADLATPDYADWANAQYVVVSMSDSATYQFDAIAVNLPSTCAKPTALDVQPNGEDVVVDWVSEATAHYAEIALGDSVVFAGNVTKPFTPANLEGNTLYTVRVRAICDADSSEWSAALSFKTPCAFAELPYNEGFENCASATSFPGCWDSYVISGPGTAGFQINTTTGDSYNHSGSKSLKLVDMQSTTYSLAVLPMFNSPRQKGLTLSFWMYRTTGSVHADEGVRVWVNNVPSLEGATPLMHVTRYGGVVPADDDTLKVAPVTAAGWYQFETVLPLAGATYVMFEGISEYGSASYIDDIKVVETPTCLKPTRFTFASATTNSATFRWNAGGDETEWDLIYKLSSNATPDTVKVTGTPALTINGLQPGKNYTLSGIKLQAICSETDSAEVASFADVAFATECAVAASVDEDFEAFATGSGLIPTCWTLAYSSSTTYPYLYSSSYYSHSGSKLLYAYGSTYSGALNAVLAMPELTAAAGGYQLSFWAYKSTVSSAGNLIVGVMTNATDTATFVPVATINLTGSYAQYNVDLASYTGAGKFVAFKYTNLNTYIYIDDVILEPVPTCDRLGLVTVKNVTGSTVTIEARGANNATLEYALGSTDATPVSVSDTIFTVAGLAPITSYELYVRRVCSASDKSGWTKVTFTTDCGVEEMPYSENFSESTIPTCWKQFSGAVTDTVQTASLSSGSGWSRNVNVFTNGGVKANIYGSYSAPKWLVSPAIHVTSAANLDFDVALTGYGSTSPVTKGGQNDDKFYVIISTDEGSTWLLANAMEWNNTDSENTYDDISNTGTHVRIPLDAYIGNTIKVAFVGLSTVSNGDNDLHISNVVVAETAACENPVSVSVVARGSSSVTLHVNDAEDANAWEYVLGTVDGTEPTAFATADFTVAGLEPNETYNIYVRRVCSAGVVSSWTQASFKTTCAATALPFEEGFEDVTFVPDCWYTERIAGSGTAGWVRTTTSSNVHTGLGAAQLSDMTDGTRTILVTPAFENTNNAPLRLSFAMYRTTGTSKMNEGVKAWVNSTPDLNGATPIMHVTRCGGVPADSIKVDPISTAGWYSYTKEFTANGTFYVIFEGISEYGSSSYMDDVMIEEVPSCDRPQSIATSNATAVSVDVVISDNVSEHTAWEVVVVAKDANPTTSTPVLVNSKAATIPGTFVSGVYNDVYVRTICGEGNVSAWRGPVTFRYVDFSSITSIPVQGVGNYPWTISETGNRLESTNQGVNSSTSDLEATFDVPAGAIATVSFQYYASGEGSSSMYDYLCMYVDQANPSTSNYNTAFGKHGTPNGQTGTFSFNLSEGTHKVLWRFYKDSSADGGEDKGQIWDIQVSYSWFFAPSGLGVEEITDNSAKLTWNPCLGAVSNQVNLKANGLDTLVTVTDNFLQMTGLEANKDYQFRVRSFADNGDSTVWSSYKLFKTLCGPTALPLYEDFDDVTAIPECWSNTHVAGTSTTTWSVSTTGAIRGKAAYLSSQSTGNKVQLATPMFAVEAGKNYRVSFYMKHSSTSSNTSNYWNENIEVKAGAQLVDTVWNSYVRAGFTQYTNPEKHVLRWTAAKDTVISLTFTQECFNGYSVSLDEILVEEVPECEAPAGISVVTLADSLVAVHVEDNDTAHTAWQVALCAPSVAADSSAAQLAVTDSAAIARIVPAPYLIADSTYVIYARAICGEGVYSPWISKTIKYIDYSALSTTLSFTSEGDYPWEIITDNGVAKAQNTNDTVSNSYSDLVTTIVVPAGEIGTLSFDFTVSAYPNMNYFVMYVDEANPDETNYDEEFGKQKSTYTESTQGSIYAGSIESTYTFTPVDSSWTVELGEGAHTIRWRYYNVFAEDSQTYEDYTYDYYDGYTYYDVTENYVYGEMGRHARIYNVQYTSTPTWAPRNLDVHAIGADSAIVTWKQCQNVVKNEVKVGENIYTSTADSIILRGLENNTQYKLVVRSITATDTTAWSDTLAFRTECGIVNLPYATGFEAADGGLACWTVRQSHAPTSGTTQYGDEGWQLTTRTDATSTSSSIHSGLAAVQLRDASDGTRTLLISPEFEADTESLVKIGFWMYRTISTSYQKADEGVKVWANTADNLTDATAIIHVTSWGGAAGGGIKVDPVATSGWYHYEAVLPAGATYAIFEGISEYGRSSYLDDVRISRVALGDTIHDAICEGYPYTQNGFNIPASELTPGYHEYSVVVEATDPSQADSIRPLVLYVSQATTIEVTDTVCYGGSYTKNGFNRSNITASRDLRYDGVNMYGCDSTFIAHIFVPEHDYTSFVNICEGESYVFGDTTIYTAGRYVKTFQKSDCDCDSTVTLVLNVLAASSEYSYTICQGETYTFGTKTYNATGDYTATFKNVLGCDSVVTLHLTVQAPVVTTFNETFCEGTVFTADNVSPKFVALSAAGEYRDTIKTVSGCDSILVLNLTETKTVKVTLNEEVCKNDLYVFAGNTFNVVNDTTITFNTVSEVTGCDSIVTLNIKAKDCGDALENVRAYELEINPNPVNVGEEAIIRTDIVFTAGYVLRVYDPAGRLVCESTDPNGRVPGLPVAGAYTVRISAADHNYQAKLIVK